MLCDDRKKFLGHKCLQAQVAQSSPSAQHTHALQHWEWRLAGRAGSVHQQRHSMGDPGIACVPDVGAWWLGVQCSCTVLRRDANGPK